MASTYEILQKQREYAGRMRQPPLDLGTEISKILLGKIMEAQPSFNVPEDWPPVMTKTDVCKYCNVGTATVNRWWKDPTFPKFDDGKYVGKLALFNWLNKLN